MRTTACGGVSVSVCEGKIESKHEALVMITVISHGSSPSVFVTEVPQRVKWPNI